MDSINIYQFLNKKEILNSSISIDDLTKLRNHLIQKLQNSNVVYIDLSNLRSLSPSFAYEVFGKLADKLEGLEDKLKYSNDKRNLKTRILNALSRRKNVLQHS